MNDNKIADEKSATTLNIEEKLIPFKGMRKIIADRMRKSLDTSVQANHRIKVDMTAIIGLRKKLKDEGRKISITDILIKALSYALAENPIMNSTLTDAGILILNRINIGIAVAINDGLVVPVIKDVINLTLDEISKVTTELIDKAKGKKLGLEEMSGGTFTITNLGMYGIDNFTAIINPPETGILAIGSIIKTPVIDDNDIIVIRPILELSLTYDHRVVDGAPAAKFLQTLKKYLEKPSL